MSETNPTGSTVLVADSKPLSLLATAGVLHHAGMKCVCARTTEAVMRACGIPRPPSAESLLTDVGEIAGQVARAARPVSLDESSSNESYSHQLSSHEPPRDESPSDDWRVDEARPGLSAANTPGDFGVKSGNVDLIVWEVGDDVPAVLQTLAEIRERFPDLPAVLIATAKWAGLEKKTESLHAPTRCLFRPIDPESLVAVCEPLLWMPALQSMHRRRGTCPNRPGWVTL